MDKKQAQVRLITIRDESQPEIHVRCVRQEKYRPRPYTDTLSGTDVYQFLRQFDIRSVGNAKKLEDTKPMVTLVKEYSSSEGDTWRIQL